ncbi:MAG TPA: MFS transporter [Dehalococcoidia bacterium]|nr:MFS transporter [Dehalococcoidia bacterium]
MNSKDSRAYKLRWVTLGVLSLSLLLIEVDMTIVNVALPTIQKEFGASGSAVQWVVDSYVLVFAGLLLFMGSVGDRFGRKKALQGGLVLFAVASAAAAQAGSAEQLIGTRAVMGVAAALIMPATLAIIIDVFPRDEQLKAISAWSGAAILGVPGGPILGGWLLTQFYWGSVFYVAVPVAVVALVAGLALVPESRDPAPARLDRMGALLSVAMLSTVVYGIIEAPERGLLAAEVLGALTASAALGTAFMLHELRTDEPLLNVRLFLDRALSVSYLAIVLTFGSMVGMLFLLTQYLQFAEGYSPLQSGLRTVPIAAGFVAGAALADNMVKRYGVRSVMTAGLLLVAAAFAGISQAMGDAPYVALGAGLFGVGFALSFVMTPATASVMSAVPGRNVGVGSALNDTGRQVGAALGVALLGSLTKALYSSQVSVPSGLPSGMAEPAKNSVGGASIVAEVLGGSIGDALRSAASAAFADAAAVAMIAVTVVALVTAAVVVHVMPARHEAGEASAAAAELSAAAPE